MTNTDPSSASSRSETRGESEATPPASAQQTPIGARPTRQRKAVVAALGTVDDFRSAQEIHALLRTGSQDVGLTTVYRTLQALADAGEIDVLRRPDGESVYRQCSTGHHHHLVCRGCGLTVEIEGPTVESWAAETARTHGFAQIEHTLEMFGTCTTCATPSPRAR
ncbi:MAG: transcriptional repressor [Nocardioidaceae bacterium]|nr:transcriptional repressor [Nocardioidaceae bacterium]